MKNWMFLFFAITGEVIGTSLLKQSEGFSRLLPSASALVFYCISFYFLSLTLKVIPVGIAYAVWSGFGIIMITLIGRFAFGQKLDLPALTGIAFILVGVLIMNIFSKSIAR
ncbi:MAG: QacE family quaternary ammonium compound efflux SMR transporter [Endomicrobium sp.]|jgi:small multidrug resistance pump|nr:QacE family quaternary ammonium compound efflux SMR transporter [Endomicrobium sp.]